VLCVPILKLGNNFVILLFDMVKNYCGFFVHSEKFIFNYVEQEKNSIEFVVFECIWKSKDMFIFMFKKCF